MQYKYYIKDALQSLFRMRNERSTLPTVLNLVCFYATICGVSSQPMSQHSLFPQHKSSIKQRSDAIVTKQQSSWNTWCKMQNIKRFNVTISTQYIHTAQKISGSHLQLRLLKPTNHLCTKNITFFLLSLKTKNCLDLKIF